MSLFFLTTGINSNFLPTGSPGRSIGTAFQISADRPAWCGYSVETSVTSVLLGSAAREVTLLSDASNPPTTPRGSTKNQLSGVAATNIQRGHLSYMVPTGHYVLLSITTSSGTGSVTLTDQEEVIL